MPNQYTSPATIEERFWSKVCKSEGCWLWQAGAFSDGYGLFKMKCDDGKFRLRRAHRIAYEWAHNCCILPGFEVLHIVCDTPLCVRPDHLALGTTQENVEDCRRKGRQARGERNSHAKLTPGDVMVIRARHAQGESTAALARAYGLCHSTMSSLVRRQTWKHLP